MTAAYKGMVLVTGATGSIGRATVRALARRERAVVTADRSPLAGAEEELVVKHLEVDLEDDAAVADSFSFLSPGERLDHVIAIAGGGDLDELKQTDPATEDVRVFSKVVANNLLTAFVTIRNCLPMLRRAEGDRSITLVGSINAFGGYGAPGYSAAKAGLIGLSNSLSTLLGADGIRINCLVLGTTDTENLRGLAEARGLSLDLSAIAARTALKRVLDPDDVASALVAMALDMFGLTGATVVLDNGQMRVR